MSVPNEQLRLMNVHDLWEMLTLESHAAVETRAHAFHEAGHVWAASRMGLQPRSASADEDGPAFVGPDRKSTVWVAAAGFFAQGLLIEADDVRKQEDLPADAPVELIDLAVGGDIEPALVTDCIASMRNHCCCRRGGDAQAIPHLKDEEWVAANLLSILAGWRDIESIAYDLLTNDRLGEHAISRHL